ncbi:MAG: methionine adenosyltransferase domain-containing protein, partial [Opitutales bacterium]|nr:methionine adenosyltransferase domain-containing protein [Opitutales bacterium]
DEEAIEAPVAKVFDFKPAGIVKQLKLKRPIYRSTTNYGHFGKDELTWEQTNKVTALKRAIKQLSK